MVADRRRYEHRVGRRVQFPMHLGMGERVMGDQRRNVRELGRFGFQEFAARGNVVEEIADRDAGAERETGFFDGEDFSAGDLDDRSGGIFRSVRFQAQTADGCDRWQRLAAKAEGRDGQKIVSVANLRSGMALEGQHGVVAHHTAAVVGHLNEFLAAGFDVDPNAPRTRIQRVLQQLLDHRSRTLHHLAGSDLVGYIFGENVDAAHGVLRYISGSRIVNRIPLIRKPRMSWAPADIARSASRFTINESPSTTYPGGHFISRPPSRCRCR